VACCPPAPVLAAGRRLPSPRGPALRRYAALLRPAAHHRPFAAAIVARLAISMGPLSTVLGVRATTGSYAAAGFVAAMLAVGLGAGAPVLGRLVDRHGQRRVVAIGAVLSASGTVGLALAALAGLPLPALAGIAFLAGVTLPPLSACMRAAWQALLDDPDERESAYALEAVGIELIFIIGPVIVGALLLTPLPVAPLLATGAFTLLGGLAYAATPVAGRWRPEADGAAVRPRGGALGSRGVLATLAAFMLVSVAFGTLDVSLAATAETQLGNAALVGVLFTAIAGGSLLGGLWYGSRRFTWPQHRRLMLALTVFALGLAPLAFVGGELWVLLAALALAGVGIAPSSIIAHQLIDDTAPLGARTEAQAWTGTANTAGAAAGTALAGVLVDLGGPALALRIAPFAVLAAVLLVAACRGVLTPGAGARPTLQTVDSR
jgi:MFS family permease